MDSKVLPIFFCQIIIQAEMPLLNKPDQIKRVLDEPMAMAAEREDQEEFSCWQTQT
ncbi:conserved hypothetical protein [Ricinus communis]|uniref:Uncharacterized protein n=1 Tax=Ricinus communis TaxID=3988 RepID=B9RWT7_RICCO|nr:conserved hypothetical protein [Ricinus communis]